MIKDGILLMSGSEICKVERITYLLNSVLKAIELTNVEERLNSIENILRLNNE